MGRSDNTLTQPLQTGKHTDHYRKEHRIIMKALLALSFLLLTQLVSAHAFYFAFAEMQYNEKEERFEITLRATGHDVEKYMEVINSPIGKLEECTKNPIKLKQLERAIDKGFRLSIAGVQLTLELLGLEINVNDEVSFYLASRRVKKPDSLGIEFNFLMDYFDEQQNKLTIFEGGEKHYLSFLPHMTQRTFEFNKL
jgi:hypothetical protein